ncbi:MAG: hypothetical protein Q4F95_05290 [Oscillospiraceae bacterium]|nr:hypothetical protein [Oscillospiraceae bacterium]
MPQISKIRVVNCWYNNGKRLIPDETFDFLSPSAQPNNTLIALANGGGKSVLVQMMLQPVCPLRSLGRRIGDYFEKASDHCYILLEWKLDGSNEYLLTGISISAGARTDSEDENENKTRTLKHYTFTAKYIPSGTSDYTLDNLPLSSMENGQFKAQSFSFVRDLAKNKNNITVFSDSEHEKYRHELLNHGISRFEWENVISKVNLVEGGLIKYFEAFRTSDSLINNLLIKTIEDNQNSSGDDQSLKNLFINYSGEYSRLRENEERRGFAAQVRDEITGKLTGVEHLRELSDELASSQAVMRGFIKALGVKYQQLRKSEDDIARKTASLKDDIRHLRFEEASLVYYKADSLYSDADAEYIKALNKLEDTQFNYNDTEKKLRIMKCAHENDQIRRLTGEKQGAAIAIDQLSGNSEYLNRSQKLGYSIYFKADKEAKETDFSINDLNNKIIESDQVLEQAKKQKKELQTQYSRIKSEADTMSGRLISLDESISKKAAMLELDLVRKLDASYQTDCITDERKKLEDRRNEICEERQSLCNEKAELEKRKKEIIKEEIALTVKINELKASIDVQEKNLDEYNTASEKINELCQLFSLPDDSIYNGRLTQVILNAVKQVKAESEGISHRIILQNEQIEAAKKGCLHIPHAVLKYLDSTSIEYQTCEKYLRSGSYSKEKISQMLTIMPQLAFGIAVFDDDYEKILADSSAQWLPCVVPVFRYDDIAECAKGNSVISNRMISCYSKRYFDDPDGCCHDFENSLNSLKESYNFQQDRIKKLDDYIGICSAFTYASDFKEKQTLKIQSIKNDISKANTELSQTQASAGKTDERINEITVLSGNLDKESNAVNSELSSLNELFQDCENCHKYLEEISAMSSQLKDIETRSNKAEQIISEQTAVSGDLKASLRNAAEIKSKLNGYLEQFRDYKPTEILDDDIESLISQLSKLNENQNKSIEELNKVIERCTGEISRCRKEISRLGIEEELYAGVMYSGEREEELISQCDKLNNEKKTIESDKNEKYETRMKLMSKREVAQEKLYDFSPDKTPLSVNEISDCIHKDVIREKNSQLSGYIDESEKINKKAGEIKIILDSQGDYTKDLNLRINTVEIESDPSAQRQRISDLIAKASKEFSIAEHDFRQEIDEMKKRLDKRDDFAQVFDDIYSVIARESEDGDKYRTLSVHMQDQAATLSKLINALDTDLSKLDEKKEFLIEQCQRQGKYIYDELKTISAGSKVKINGHSTPVVMLKLDLNEEIDESAARSRIETETQTGIREYLDAVEKNDDETSLMKIADRIVSSRNLLNKYTGRDSISVRVYKIDVNEKNGTYRTWEQSLVKNSGGECFVVYFSVLLSVMSYARSSEACASAPGIKAGSVLILDNPFGAITSSHLLEPMFQIARKFRVQLICLSDISKCNITKCFDTVIRITIRKLQFSNYEILTPERDDQLEQTEHAFYKTQQISMF